MSAAFDIAGGFAKAKALKTEAAQLERVRRDEAVTAKQISAIRRDQLNEANATLDNIRVSRNLDIDSPGAIAQRRRNREDSFTNENAELLSSQNRQETLKTQAALKRRAAPFAILGGFSGAASSLGAALIGG